MCRPAAAIPARRARKSPTLSFATSPSRIEDEHGVHDEEPEHHLWVGGTGTMPASTRNVASADNSASATARPPTIAHHARASQPGGSAPGSEVSIKFALGVAVMRCQGA